MLRLRHPITAIVLGFFVAVGNTAPSFAADVPVKMGKTAIGTVLTDSAGMTLYTYDKDEGGKSMCNGPCASNWPPLMADAGAQPTGEYTVITRDDGSKQWAYDGKPLYTWTKDAKPGDTTGNGVNNVWHVAKPQ
jgi:predicted lipoprotein with Yx(FWY)xxD motif